MPGASSCATTCPICCRCQLSAVHFDHKPKLPSPQKIITDKYPNNNWPITVPAKAILPKLCLAVDDV
jgi:hypothetical protein